MKFYLSKHILKNGFLAAACAVLLSSGGCSLDSGGGACTENNEVKLRFTVVASGGSGDGTRADITDQTGSASENYLDLAGRDIRFLLFDGGMTLLRDFTPDADIAAVPGTDYITYTVQATIAEPYFANVATNDTDFYIMVIANGRPYSLQAFALAPGRTTIEDVAGQKTSFTLKTVTEAGGGWTPSEPGVAGGEYMPMSGLQHFTLKQGAFGIGHDFVELSPSDGSKDINMLRALAKIEVVDRIDIQGDYDDAPEGRSSVKKVELLGYCATGTILPDFGQWNRDGELETRQVDAPTMADPLLYRSPSGDIGNTIGGTFVDFHEDDAASELRGDKCPVFSVYTTEYSAASLSGDAVRPYLRVTVSDQDGNEGRYMLRLASYNSEGNAVEDIPGLLRNYIYRYEIVSVSKEDPAEDGALSIFWTICPMDEPQAIEIPPFS